MRVAIADDEPDVVSFLTSIIEEQGHEVVSVADGDALSLKLARERFDLLIMDWHIPGKCGSAILQSMDSAAGTRPPVIILTSRSAKKDISAALSAGADDYITKPEDRSVVAARIGAMLRRNGAGAFDARASYGKYEFNRLDQTVVINDEEIRLTAKEFELADLFFRNADRTLSRSHIMKTIWRTTAELATRTLDMHISRIRAKLNLQPENGFRISTVFGYGYRLDTMGKA